MKIASNYIMLNEEPRLGEDEWPFGALDEDGVPKLTPLTEKQFLAAMPREGRIRGHWMRGIHYTMFLGLRSSVAMRRSWGEPAEFFRVGCDHDMRDQNPRDRTGHGDHRTKCKNCGFIVAWDSSD